MDRAEVRALADHHEETVERKHDAFRGRPRLSRLPGLNRLHGNDHDLRGTAGGDAARRSCDRVGLEKGALDNRSPQIEPVAGRGARIAFLSAVFLSGCASLFREVNKDLILVNAALSDQDVEITLDNSFITTFKDRATIQLWLTVEKAGKGPHPAFWDGDFHAAGQSPAIGLPVVAEIANAASEDDAIDRIHRAESSGKPLRVAGAWRLWSEHAGDAEEHQGTKLAPTELTNPGHVFEIHPMTFVDDRDLRGSFRPVAGYRPGTAGTVFKSLGKIPCRISSRGAMTAIVTRTRQFNDVEFLLELTAGRQVVVEDGRFLDAAALDLDGNRLVDRLRAVFVKGTPPDRLVSNLKAGDRLHVVGLPRIDLAAVAWRARHGVENPELLDLTLPYEIVVVGAYPPGH